MSAVSKYRDGGLVGSDQPSEKQKAVGNYLKGHAVLHGMRISIENEAGTDRHFTDEVGYKGKQRLAHDYGYIRGTTGKDKDHIDVFLGPKASEPDAKVYVIDQNKLDGSFDEHKVMLGFEDADDAVIGYHSNYEPGFGGFHAVTEMPIQQFKSWAYAGKAGKRKRASELVAHQDQHQVPPDGGERPAISPAESTTDPLKDRKHQAGDDLGDIGPDQGTSFAEGGSVDDEDLTRPAFRTPMVAKRREDRQDRTGSADMPLQLLRGAAAGTAGLPGDIESLLRLLPGLDRETMLPTSEDVLERLPLGSERPGAKTAAEAGTLLGMASPWTGGARLAAKGAKGLGKLAGEALDAGMHGEGPLSKVLAPSQPAFAVKMGDTPEEIERIKQYQQRWPRAYAKGGAVGTETVGLGTFGGADQPQQPQAMQLPAMPTISQPAAQQFNGVSFSGGHPIPASSTGLAPTYDLNTAAGQGLLGMTMGAMGAGRLDRGVSAFMDPQWSEIPTGVFNQGIDGPGAAEVRERTAANNQPLLDLMRARGQDISGIDPGSLLEPTAGPVRRGLSPLTRAYDQAQSDLKDYWRVRGASTGWDQRGNPRSIASTLYQNDNNVWRPISAPQYGVQPTNPGWIRGEGSELVAAASMMLPAVGGFAGLASSLAPSAYGAATGAIGSTATNALINGVAGGLLTGDPLSGLLSAGSGALGGAAGSAIGDAIGPGYGALGQYLGNQAGRLAYNQTRRT